MPPGQAVTPCFARTRERWCESFGSARWSGAAVAPWRRVVPRRVRWRRCAARSRPCRGSDVSARVAAMSLFASKCARARAGVFPLHAGDYLMSEAALITLCSEGGLVPTHMSRLQLQVRPRAARLHTCVCVGGGGTRSEGSRVRVCCRKFSVAPLAASRPRRGFRSGCAPRNRGSGG